MNASPLKIVWVNPCFLDYRVPVYTALSNLVDGNLTVVFSADRTSDSVKKKISKALGNRAIALKNERKLNIGSNLEGKRRKRVLEEEIHSVIDSKRSLGKKCVGSPGDE